MQSSTLYGVILGQWLCGVYLSFVQHPCTGTQSVYAVLDNLMQFQVRSLYEILLFKYFSDLKEWKICY